MPSLDCIEKGQCFPRWIYDPKPVQSPGELAFEDPQSQTGGQRDAITDAGYAHAAAAYPSEELTKEDIFYYVYGLLHSPDYRRRFADNLTKELPRIPLVARAADFRAFVEAGRRLADLHCDFDAVDPWPVTFAQGDLRLAHIGDPVQFFRVEKMSFAGKRPHLDRTTIIYNAQITLTGIPLDAYDYVINGKSAIEWVMERQGVRVDKASGIVWDANAFARQAVRDPAYPLHLLQRVITIGVETVRIVSGLPPLGELLQ